MEGESQMKVTDVKTFLVSPENPQAGFIGGKHWLFVKVETDAGISGWGEAYTLLDRDRAIERQVLEMARYLVDRDPSHIKHFTSMVYNDFAGRRGAMDLYSGLSAIEQAMWDITGKRLGAPVYTLLGGPCRDRIRVYANGWYAGSTTPEEYAAKARETVRRGFTALKLDPFPGPWRLFVSREQEELAVDTVRAVREAVGTSVDLLIEVHRRLAPMHAVRVSRALEPLQPYWYEEPVPAENLDALAEVRGRTSIPIVTGETLYTKGDFRAVFEKRAADIINPDVCNCGGILELKEIAAMAEPSFVAVAPHNYNSTTVGLAATVQVSACIPNFLITKYFLNFEETGRRIASRSLEPENGSIPLPKEPGLGITLDEAELLRRSYQPYPPRRLRRYDEEEP